MGHAINQKTTLRKTPRTVTKRHGIPNVELIRAYTSLLAAGKSDFEAIENIRNDDWFKNCMDIRQMPSASRLRQRFDEDASALMPLVNDSLAEVVVNLDAPLTALPKRLDKQQHIALDIDVFPMDNSGTKKEGVAYTYKGHDGYAPISAYLGQEGWCLGCDLRTGSQHSQKEFIPFLAQVIQRAKRITRESLLLRLDSGHDAEDSRKEVARHKNVEHIIKLNPRSTYTTERWLPQFEDANIAWQPVSLSGMGKTTPPYLLSTRQTMARSVWFSELSAEPVMLSARCLSQARSMSWKVGGRHWKRNTTVMTILLPCIRTTRPVSNFTVNSKQIWIWNACHQGRSPPMH